MRALYYNQRDRRLQGRKKNPNKPPKPSMIRVYPATKDRIDRLWPYPGMPLGDRLDAILAHYEKLKRLIKS